MSLCLTRHVCRVMTLSRSSRLSAEFRAAAAVRAAAFYTYPSDRAFAAAAHQRMKARRSCLVPCFRFV